MRADGGAGTSAGPVQMAPQGGCGQRRRSQRRRRRQGEEKLGGAVHTRLGAPWGRDAGAACGGDEMRWRRRRCGGEETEGLALVARVNPDGFIHRGAQARTLLGRLKGHSGPGPR